MKKKTICVIIIAALAALSIVMNKKLPSYNGVFILSKEYTEIVSSQVVQGDENELSIEITKPGRVKVLYGGDYALEVLVTLKDSSGEEDRLRLYVYQENSFFGSDTVGEFLPID